MAEFFEPPSGEDFRQDKLPDFAPVRAVTQEAEAGVVVAEEFSVADDDSAVHAKPDREDPAVLVCYGGQDSRQWDLGAQLDLDIQKGNSLSLRPSACY
nr:hypothetical protein Iba_chr06bCG5950 [Ipomoea batatas]